jgi:hypothetical protein
MPIEVVGFSRPLDADALRPGDMFVSVRHDQTTLFMRLGLPGGSFALAIGDLRTGEAGVYVTHMDELEGPVISVPGQIVIRPSSALRYALPATGIDRNSLIIFGTGKACLTAVLDKPRAFSLTDASEVHFEAEPSGYLAYSTWSVHILRDRRLGTDPEIEPTR